MEYNVKARELSLMLSDKKIYGQAFIPECTAEKLPAVILSHGYNSGSENLYDIASALAENGFFAYAYDFCGGSAGSKSSGSSTDMSVNSEIADLNDVIGYIQNMDNIDNDRIFLYGESQGGFVSALAADERIKGLYLLYPAFCIPDNWKNRKISDTIIFMGMHLSQKFCDGLPEYDVFEHIGQYRGKVRIFQGDNDGLVDVSYAEKVRSAFPNAALDIFPGEGHGFSPEARKKLISMICADIKNYI